MNVFCQISYVYIVIHVNTYILKYSKEYIIIHVNSYNIIKKIYYNIYKLVNINNKYMLGIGFLGFVV